MVVLLILRATVPVNLSVAPSSGCESAQNGVTVTAPADSAVCGDKALTVGTGGTGITGDYYSLSDATLRRERVKQRDRVDYRAKRPRGGRPGNRYRHIEGSRYHNPA